MIDVEKDPMGMGGDVWRLDQARDLDALAGARAAMVRPRVAKLFRGFPDALGPLADEAPLPSMARWLRSLRDARCVLEIYRTKHFGDTVHVRFVFDESWSPAIRGIAGRMPSGIAPVLREVHRLVGGVDLQYGCSGTLVAGTQMKTARAIVRERDAMATSMAAYLGSEPARDPFSVELCERFRKKPSLARWRVVLEADGDHLCADARGSSAWLGMEWTGQLVTRAPKLDGVLDRFFAELCSHNHHWPGRLTG